MRRGFRRTHDREVRDTALRKAGLIPPRNDKRWKKEFLTIPPLEARVAATSGKTARYAEKIDSANRAKKVATSRNTAKYIVGRALRDLAQNRGYAVTRSLERTTEVCRSLKDVEKTKTGSAKAALLEKVATRPGDNKKPLCHWLLERHKGTTGSAGRKGKKGRKKGLSRRFRKGTGTDLYEFFPDREMFEHEIRLIREKNADLATPEQWDEIVRRITWQRPLKRPIAGKCTFFPSEERLPKWHPIVGEIRILQDLNGIRIIDDMGGKRPLDANSRDVAFAHLMSGDDLTWTQLRRIAKIPFGHQINREEEEENRLLGHETVLALRGTKGSPGVLAETWDQWTSHLEDMLAILDGRDPDAADSPPTDDPETVIDLLVKHVGMDRKLATAVEKIGLPKGRSRLGKTAAKVIVEIMHNVGCEYSKAVKVAGERRLLGEGVHHSGFGFEKNLNLDKLPRYNTLPFIQRFLSGTGDPADPDDKRFGTVSNPTIHIWLGQFMHTVNALIRHFGKPEKIVIEAPHDMVRSEAELIQADRERRASAKHNERLREKLIALGKEPNRKNILKMRLWEELATSEDGHVEVYTGKAISLRQALEDTEIEYILPQEDTLDNSFANMTLAFRKAKSKKTKGTIADAWSEDDLEAIIMRVRAAPKMRWKLWRFFPDALEYFANEADFEARQLAARGWMERLMLDYPEALFPNDGKRHVEVPGSGMTARLRHQWGLNLAGNKGEKDPTDHRNHELDAITLAAFAQPGTIQNLIEHDKRQEGRARQARTGFPEPYEGFVKEAREGVAKSLSGHRPLHRIGGTFAKEGLYGEIRNHPRNAEDLAIGNTVMRVEVPTMSQLDLRHIRHLGHRKELARFAGISDDKERRSALTEWCQENEPRAMRVIKPNKTARGMRDRKTGKVTRFAIPHQYAYIDIIADGDGEWAKFPFMLWDAMAGEHMHKNHAHPDPGFKMRLYKNDLVQMFHLDNDSGEVVPGTNAIYRVVHLNPSRRGPKLAGVNEAGNLEKRDKDDSDRFQWHIPPIPSYKARRARRVFVDRIGRIRTVPIGKI